MMITCQVALRIRMNPSKGSAFTSVRKILVDLFISLFIIKADYSEKIRYLSTYLFHYNQSKNAKKPIFIYI